MANNQGYLTEGETSDEISISYRMMNPPDDDENNEEIVEYLDLDLVTSSVHETVEYCSQVAPTTSTKNCVQPSVLKVNCPKLPKTKLPRSVRSKPVASKPSLNLPEKSIVCTRSSADNKSNIGSAVHTTEKQISNFVDSDSSRIQAVVNDINARLADSAKYVNGHGTHGRYTAESADDSFNANSIQLEQSNSKNKTDGLDLFFQSMAQTIMTLPPRVQATIKMDICNVIATAEMKYSTLDRSQELARD